MNKEVGEALKVLIEALKTDKDYRILWRSNIAMAFKDEYYKIYNKYSFSQKELNEIDMIAVISADNFLTLLCRQHSDNQESLSNLFAVKNKLENSRDKKQQHALGFINEAIKWLQQE